MKEFDLIIIGAGRASSLAHTASKLGKKVALIEKSTLGGTCPNRGCVPSKLLVGYAHAARNIKDAPRHFIDLKINSIDVGKIFEVTNDYVTRVDARHVSRLNDNITLFRGIGSFVSNKIVKVNGEELSAKHIVIATGTRPSKPLHDKAWTSDDIFPLKGDVPKNITIVGSGFIAVELANFFSAVGVDTKLIVRSNTLLSIEDSEISEIFKTQFTKNVDVVFNTSIKSAKYEDNHFELELQNRENKTTIHKSEALLYAIGRKSNSDLLNLENTTIELDKRGFIKRDEFLQTSAEGVYVVGDASGEYMLQHAATSEVNYLGKHLFKGENEPLRFKYMPHGVFSDPEVASVGYTEKKAQEMDLEYVALTIDWLSSAKAMSSKLDYPRTKFIVDPNTYEILGCHIIGPDSTTLLHQVLTVMNMDNDVRHLKEMLYAHPALSEAILSAAVEVVKKVEEYKKDKK